MASIEEQLIKTYQEAQQSLINTIATKDAKGNSSTYQRTLLKQVNSQISELTKEATKWTKTNLPKEYKKGVESANSGLEDLGAKDIKPYETFAKLHTKQVELLVHNTTQDLVDANMFVGRQIQDAVRQAGIEATAQKVSQGQTVKQMKNLLSQKLIAQGLNGIRTRNGSMIRLDSYADVVARSTTRESQNKGLLNQLSSLGYDLVKMSEHLTSCPVCASLQGRVYSISGKDTRYPSLTRAYSGAHANIHPRCRHVLMPYVEALADDPEKDREKSNKSFEIDKESQKKFDNYNKQQKELRQLRNDKRQWENYKLALPEDAPKTLSAFRKMKTANSERYQQLQIDYRDGMSST